jgi:hypothetical protein
VNSLLLWFNQTGSPPNFDRFAARWTPWAFAFAFVGLAVGIYGALFAVPVDGYQGEPSRILYIHVPCAWMSLFVFVVMAVQAFIALVWRIKACEILAMACAPLGAMFTVVTLATGSIWGKPTWGTWWTWDPRLTSELVLLFLYAGVMGLFAAIEDRRSAARGVLPRAGRSGQHPDRAFLGRVVEHAAPGHDDPSRRQVVHGRQHGVAADFYDPRHQGLVRRLAAAARAGHEPGAGSRQGLGARRRGGRAMSSPYVTAAYLEFAVALAWDYLLPRLRLRRAQRDILAGARRDAARAPAATTTQL